MKSRGRFSLFSALVLSISFGVGCSDYTQGVPEVGSELEQIPNPNPPDRTLSTTLTGFDIAACEGLLIEVVAERNGMVLPNGKLISLRLLKDGRAEYDSITESLMTIRKTVVLSQSSVEKITAKLSSVEFRALKQSFVTRNNCVDSTFEREINYCEGSNIKKTIRIQECGLIDPNLGEELPEILNALLHDIDQITR